MEWQSDPNKRALLIIRRSGYGQKENTSGETQRREGLEYANKHGLEVVHQQSIIETAFKRKERHKFKALLQKALKEKIRHLIFFWSSREARNLTDLEAHDDLIKAGQLIIHHVSESKTYWKNTPDSDFTFREINAVINKSESRSKSTMLKAALRTKGLSGWFPYRHCPLGYRHIKDKDRFGNAIKGTAKVIPDEDVQRVRIAQKEFELRAQGLSYDEIRKRNLLEAGLVPEGLRKTYSRHAIEGRLKNPFYWGYFYLTDDPVRYEGKHERIIPENILKAVQAINNGNVRGRNCASNGDDIFRGWIRCHHPDCQRLITYDKKQKVLKSTGEAKVYHLYRCADSRQIHPKRVYISEVKIWDQFESGISDYSITDGFAKDIMLALEEAMNTQRRAHKKQMEGYRIALKELEGREDAIYRHFTEGILDKEGYQRQVNKIRAERDDYNHQLEDLTLLIHDIGSEAVKRVFELAINADSQWKYKNREERLHFLKVTTSNQTLEDLTIRYQLQKPFERLAKMKGSAEWRREVLNLRTEAIQWASA
jgi:DNA invertase Pin-like site-specific DNA recombinase